MITMANEKLLALAEDELTLQIVRLANGELGQRVASELARSTAQRIDWNNSALMHKGFSWIAKQALENSIST